MLTLDHLLADSCSNPDTNFNPKLSLEENKEASEGWSIYTIELHCLEYRISAKKVTDGVYNQEKECWEVPPHYDIRSFETRSI